METMRCLSAKHAENIEGLQARTIVAGHWFGLLFWSAAVIWSAPVKRSGDGALDLVIIKPNIQSAADGGALQVLLLFRF